ncbi:MAG: flagellar protein FlaG [Planctomycetota bacterium]
MVFHVETNGRGTFIQILDSESREVFREIPAAEFVAFAKTRKDLGALIWGNVEVSKLVAAKATTSEHPLS